MTRPGIRWVLWLAAGAAAGWLVLQVTRSAGVSQPAVSQDAPAADDYFETASGRYHLEHGSRAEETSVVAPAPAAPEAPAAGATLPVSVEVAAAPAEAPVTAPVQAPVGPLQVRWPTADFSAALTEVSEWVSARQGFAVATNDHHVSIRLPQAEVASFLERFSSDAGNMPFPAAPPAASVWVTISLELVPQP